METPLIISQNRVVTRNLQKALCSRIFQKVKIRENKGQKLIFEFDHSDCLAFSPGPGTTRKTLLGVLEVTASS